jgi:hypothetical protein
MLLEDPGDIAARLLGVRLGHFERGLAPAHGSGRKWEISGHGGGQARGGAQFAMINGPGSAPQARYSTEVHCPGQDPPLLLEGDEFRIVPIDHHAVMIDPRTSLQAHTPLETRTALQAHTPLEEGLP